MVPYENVSRNYEFGFVAGSLINGMALTLNRVIAMCMYCSVLLRYSCFQDDSIYLPRRFLRLQSSAYISLSHMRIFP